MLSVAVFCRYLVLDIVLTPAELGMKGAIEKAEEIKAGNPNVFIAQQFLNPANPDIHRTTTAEEIWQDSDGSWIFLLPA